MPRALVVFESMFGNTRDVAAAVADGLSSRMPAEAVEVGAAPADLGDDVDLLVVGGPTHAFTMSRPSTRQDAGRRSQGSLVSAGPGIREWLAGVEGVRDGMAAATFDTRVARPRLPGSAARAAGRRLRRLGARLVARPVSFWVTGMQGPLAEGEEARARRWGADLASTVTGDAGAEGPARRRRSTVEPDVATVGRGRGAAQAAAGSEAT